MLVHGWVHVGACVGAGVMPEDSVLRNIIYIQQNKKSLPDLLIRASVVKRMCVWVHVCVLACVGVWGCVWEGGGVGGWGVGVDGWVWVHVVSVSYLAVPGQTRLNAHA